MNKEKVYYVIVILTYRNISDLEEFFLNLKNIDSNSLKIIVVNSYFDDYTLDSFKNIAYKNGCDFISVENKGYSYGNNKGVEYAIKNYDFKFLIISNPDIIIKKMENKDLEGFEDCIIAPRIKTLKGKNQNPYYYKKDKFVQWLKYISCKKEWGGFTYLAIAINKVNREVNLFIDKMKKQNIRKVYACHGSFIIIGYKALRKMKVLFNNQMFLFAEEEYLAAKAATVGVDIYMNSLIQVIHKEDGSIHLENININQMAKKSFQIYYEDFNGY